MIHHRPLFHPFARQRSFFTSAFLLFFASTFSPLALATPPSTRPAPQKTTQPPSTRPTPSKAVQIDESGWYTDLASAQKAANGQRPLIVNVHAAWCPPCNQLHLELFDTPRGKAWLTQAIGAKIDFDTPHGQAATQKLAIFNLPTTVVLSPQGKEIGRIEGYNGHREYDEMLRALLAGQKGEKDLEALYRQAPHLPRHQIQYAQLLLIRKQPEKALALLQPLFFQPTPHGTQATRLWGRWLLRVQKQLPAAQEHFAKAAKAYRHTPYYAGFLYWYAKSLHANQRSQEAVEIFHQWQRETPLYTHPTFFLIDFLAHTKHDPPLKRKHLRALSARLKSEIKQRHARGRLAWLAYLDARDKADGGDLPAAKKAIQEALRYAPTRAIFKNFARRLQHQQSAAAASQPTK
jgi:tetratricopeptide (TPR) repeat protein